MKRFRLFAISMVVIVGGIALSFIYQVGNSMINNCYDPDCNGSTRISRDIYFHQQNRKSGYVYNAKTCSKILKHIDWIAMPADKDSLVCFSNGRKRGYFSKNTGRVVIEPRYSHAWAFSEGLACVEENGQIKFIDGTGKVVIDKDMAYNPKANGYMFRGGYCVVYNDDGERCGLMDKSGNIVLPMEYNSVELAKDSEHWCVEKGKEMAVLDKNLQIVFPLTECSIYVGEGTIDVKMPDHTIRKYDMQGLLINDFYVVSIRTLEYEKDEILYRQVAHVEDGHKDTIMVTETYHPKAIAQQRAYVAGDGYEGLMTADGHIVTMPLYRDIVAISNDHYLCTYTNNGKVIVNGKGEIVR